LEAEGETNCANQLRRASIGAHDVIRDVPLNRRVLSQAGGVIVHSMWTWDRVRKLVSVPVTRIPHFAEPPTLPSRDGERRRLGLPLDQFVIATLGFVGPPKRISSIFRAVAELPDSLRKRTLILVVGYAPPSEEKALRDLADELRLSSQVRFVGRVKLSDFPAYARAADVCVQLRYPTRGETSGALLRELAAGAACIVSDHGSIAELPDEVVVKVRTPENEVSDLTAALCRLYHNPDERARLGAAAVRHVKDRHSLEHVVAQYAAMIELTSAQREADDARWSEYACDALAACTNPQAVERRLHQWIDLRGKSISTRRKDVEQSGLGVTPRGSVPTAQC
jgi:glycosyltransferase involved in cell wall biosynthesis